MINYKLSDLDKFNSLPMPDGRKASDLRMLEFAAVMQKLKIPTTADMGKTDMMRLYHDRVLTEAEKFQPVNAKGVYPADCCIKRAVEALAGA